MKLDRLSSIDEITAELGCRLKQARLNKNASQAEVASHCGLSRKTVMNAEKGQASLKAFVSIMHSLQLIDQLECFLPEPGISPIQMLKLRGKQRQRASGLRQPDQEPDLDW
ncbi:transcriptional regulator [Pelagibaculum spongiae]|uniref:Transcriptional regulator n=1 Tax=Pelagibaculum spongiae TaxID=2080658 RepID=A0A2V1GXA8_9GAMM|nr:transcriptional regulator [Pelagibaculum spongiae]PVZ64485.1 transcriptional regulator [Pelagibaculum spongiae]